MASIKYEKEENMSSPQPTIQPQGPVKPAKCFDIQDKRIPTALYALMMSGALVDIDDNDRWYQIWPFGSDMAWSWNEKIGDYSKGKWNEFATRHVGFGSGKLRDFFQKPHLLEDVAKEAIDWLTKQGCSEEDITFVKIWW